MLTVHNFSYGLLTPALAYLMSCLGCFLGLRCTTRALPGSGGPATALTGRDVAYPLVPDCLPG